MINISKKYHAFISFIVLLLYTSCIMAIDRPNMVLIIADDLGWNDLGCYGNASIQTNNLDKLAKEGILFTNVYLTTSSCSPSRSSIISGRYPHNTGFPEFTYRGNVSTDLPLFPEILRKNGYYTAQAGKWHLGESTRRSFDDIYDKNIGLGGEDQWLNALQNRSKEKPFFMWFASTDPHRNWGENRFRGSNDPDKIVVPPYLADTETTRMDLANYYDEISRLDFQVGQVERELEKQGVLDNTIIIFISDNGSPFPRAKTRLYDSGIKTPMIIKWKTGIETIGRQSESLISIIDLAPTLVKLAGGRIPKAFQGVSFDKLLNNPDEKFRNYIFAEHNWHGFETYERMVRTSNWMYILNERPELSNPPPSDAIKSPSFDDLKELRDNNNLKVVQADVFIKLREREELYNCVSDPYQTRNLALVNQKELRRLRKVLRKWQKQTSDGLPEQLTPDWYDRETGQLLKGIEISEDGVPNGIRGDMPGGVQAIKQNANGPF